MSDEIDGSITLEDWAPLASSLHFHLGQFSYQRAVGIRRTQREFPNLANQGMLAGARAAELLFANCEEAASSASLPEAIRCIEYGVGDGSFGMQLLDRFQQ